MPRGPVSRRLTGSDFAQDQLTDGADVKQFTTPKLLVAATTIRIARPPRAYNAQAIPYRGCDIRPRVASDAVLSREVPSAECLAERFRFPPTRSELVALLLHDVCDVLLFLSTRSRCLRSALSSSGRLGESGCCSPCLVMSILVVVTAVLVRLGRRRCRYGLRIPLFKDVAGRRIGERERSGAHYMGRKKHG
jgi:hypothetical protein